MLLKHKFVLLVAGCVVISAATIAIALSYFFIGDLEQSFKDLQISLATLGQRTFSARMTLLHSQVEESLKRSKDPLSSLVKQQTGCVGGQIWQGTRLLAFQPLPAPIAPPTPGNSLWTLDVSENAEPAVHWIGRIGEKTIVLDFVESAFSDVLPVARGTRSDIVLADGRTLLHSNSAVIGPETRTLRDAISTGESGRFVSENGTEFLATILKLPTEPPTFVAVTSPWAVVGWVIRMTWLRSAWIAAVLLLLSVGIATVFASSLTVPLQVLGSRIRELAAGKFDPATPLYSGRKDEVGMLTLSFNGMIRELHQMRETLRRTERLAALGKFSAGIAHEIKNPLSGILSNTQVVKRQLSKGKFDRGDAVEALTLVEEETLRANRIITQLMKFSRKESPPTAAIELGDRIKRSLAFLQSTLNGAGVELTKKIPTEPIYCMANGDQIHEVILNLIQNAVHAVKSQKRKQISVEVSTKGREAWITIQDYGVGMSEETKNHLFEPFYTTKPIGEGTGLGLAVCHGIIQNHQGEIEVQSKLGEGTRFIVRLPLGSFAIRAEKKAA